MEKKNNNGIVIVLMGVIIVILFVLCILFATGKLIFNNENPVNSNIEETNNNSEMQNNNYQDGKKYSDFIGTWRNNQTKDEIIIKNVTNNEVTFTWNLYRLTSVDDITLAFENGKGIFYFQGYYDKNFDGEQTDDEKYMRKATIKLTDNGVNVVVEDVPSIDSNYKLLDNFDGSAYMSAGTYTHTDKYK